MLLTPKISSEWDKRFLRLALEVSSWSKDPSTKVGAVIVRSDRRIVSTGYNGFPRNVLDAPELIADRAIKYKRTVHAELNAILQAREPLDSTELYCTLPPCASCAGAIVQAGIKHVSFLSPGPETTARWSEEWTHMLEMFKQAKITTWSYAYEDVFRHP